MDEKKIEKLYELLERAEKEHDSEAVAALRWAIFQLEHQVFKPALQKYKDMGNEEMVDKFIASEFKMQNNTKKPDQERMQIISLGPVLLK